MSRENVVRTDTRHPPEFLAGGGEMGTLMRSWDWSHTSLGPSETWPQSLRTTVSILVNSAYPMFLAWGPQLAFLYNDGYRPIFGDKHPNALGRPFAEVWAEIWADIRPLVDRALSGERTWSDDMRLFMERSGYREECYFTFSYSPVRDESGGVGGMFCACTETTDRVLSERRTRTLQKLGSVAVEAKTVEDAKRLCLQAIESNPEDLPFALLYQFEPEHAHLVGWTGAPYDTALAPRTCAFNEPCLWPLSAAARGETVPVSNLDVRLGQVTPASAWGDPVTTAVVVPIASRASSNVHAALVLGVNPRRVLDGTYREFLGFVGGSVATALANAQAFEDERRRSEALAELDQAKTTFFSNVSHEFRTPLTLLLGPLEDALCANGALPPPVAENLDVAYRNALRLQKLVNTLLDFSRIEAGRVHASYEPTDLGSLTADLASNFRSAMEKGGLRFTVECAALPEPVYVDREMWEKVVLNLLSNAIKHTFEGEVAVRLTWRGDHAALIVSDTGVGISSHDLPHLFERFHRIRGARARTQEGTGIGLALVQELVKLHGGSVCVESTEGLGTTFTVSIPAGSAHLPQERIGGSRGKVSTSVAPGTYVDDAVRWLPDGRQPGFAGLDLVDPAPPLSKPSPDDSGLRPRIIVADDNADMRMYICRLLTERFDVEAFADGKVALDAIRQRPPDLVLSDVMMPELDGFRLLAEIRSDPVLREIPFIILSARAGEEARIEGVQAGADDYLVKPFSAREVIARVATHLNIARVRRETTDALRQADHAKAQRIAQQRQLLDLFSSMRLDANASVEAVLQAITEHVRQVIGAHGSVTSLTPGGDWSQAINALSLSDEYASYRTSDVKPDGLGIDHPVSELKRPFRMKQAEREAHPSWRGFGKEAANHLPMGGWLAAPLVAFDGGMLGLIQLSGKYEGEFTEEDEVTLWQFAQIASAVLENVRLYKELRESELRFRNIANTAPAMLWITEPDGSASFLSRGWYEFTGQTEEQALGLGWLDAVHPEDHDRAGSIFLAANEKREPFDLDYRLRRSDGEYRWAIDSGRPRYGTAGEFLGYIGSVIDVHERKRAEEAMQLSNEDLRRANADLEQFAYSASHDLQEPIRNVAVYCEVLSKRYGQTLDANGKEFLAFISNGAKRMDMLVKDLLAYTQSAEMEGAVTEAVGATAALEKALSNLSAAISEADAEISYDPLPSLHVREVQLQQLFQNLIGNAIKYRKDDVRPAVHVAARRSGSQWLFSVRDNGIGIAPEYKERVFGIFKRLHGEGKYSGTGIGLAICQRIVERNGGRIWLESEGPGKGSTFRFTLPGALTTSLPVRH